MVSKCTGLMHTFILRKRMDLSLVEEGAECFGTSSSQSSAISPSTGTSSIDLLGY